MIYLVLSILSSTLIFWVFRHSSNNSRAALPIICMNYVVASIVGIMLILISAPVSVFPPVRFPFAALSILIGLGFIGMFLLIQFSTKIKGVSITSISTKLSVVIPITISVMIDPKDTLNLQKILGLCLALVALVFMVRNKMPDVKEYSSSFFVFLLPLILFTGMGVIDSLVKISQQFFLTEINESVFTTFVFIVSAVVSTFIVILSGNLKYLFNRKNFYYGFLLGIANYGSLFFLVKALNLNKSRLQFLDSSRIFMINNMGIVFLSTIMGVVLFKEKATLTIYMGLILSIAGFYLLT